MAAVSQTPGELGLPSGHLNGSEDVITALVRELREELTIAVEPQGCQLKVVMHRAAESPSDPEYLDFFFAVKSWAGHPAVGEPVKCSELVWVSQSRLASDVIDYVRAALEAIASGTALVWHGW